MPDPMLMIKALATAAVISALVAAAGRRRAGAFQALAVFLGAAAGLAMLGVRPRWPMREDQDRFLGLVLPGVILAEAVLNSIRTPALFRSPSMILVSAVVSPTLLFASVYVADLSGPGSAIWPPLQRYVILAGLGAALFFAWWLQAWTARRSGSALRVPLSLATAILGASACVMLSGYATGGMNGLPIAGALAGSAIAAAWFRGDGLNAMPGVGITALFGLLLSGWAFGELRTDAAALLFLAPLLATIPEIPPHARLRPWARSTIAMTLVATAAAGVTGLTIHRFLSP